MKVSREQMAANRRRVLDEAGRLFRERGFDQVSVAEVMNAAGLTHGGFYGHFASKDELIAAAIAHVLGDERTGAPDLDGFRRAYLSAAHRDDRSGGCPIAGLGAEAARQGPGASTMLTAGLRHQLERLETAMSRAGEAAPRQAAIGAWATMVGAMMLSRMVDDPALSDELLGESEAWLAAKVPSRRDQ